LSDDYPTSVRFSKQLKADLKRFAKEQGCSVTWLLNHIAEEWVEHKKQEGKGK